MGEMAPGMNTKGMRDDDITGVDPKNAVDDPNPAKNVAPQRHTAIGRKVGNITVGTPAPELTATKLEGSGGGGPLRIAALKNRPTLLVFGSHSAPAFRAKAPELERLKTKYGNVIGIWLIYTKEAYPVSDWDVERNRTAKVRIDQPASYAARVAECQLTKKELKLTVLTAVDDMADGSAKAYDLLPNGAVLVDKKGVIAAAQQFFDSYAMDHAVEQLIKSGGQIADPADGPATRR
jgi:hypothetical protein